MTHREYLLSLEHFGIKLGLEQIRVLLDRLDHPERAVRTVVVAGTNGKGSVSAMLERGLRAAGHRTGRYTSPHLVDLRERFAIDGRTVSADALDAAAGRVRAAAGTMPQPPSFFEATTAAAFGLFQDAGVEVAVLEVGLGGRLDATNVTHPTAVAITSVDFDHQAQLGESLPAIAAEKAAVIRSGSLVVAGANPPEVIDVVRQAAAAAGAPLVLAPESVRADVALVDGRTRLRLVTPRHDYGTMELALRGRHQADNALVAARLLEELEATSRLRVPADAVRAALEDVRWPARLDLRPWRGAEVLIDAAHNPAGARTLAGYVREAFGRRLPMVVAVMKDKAVDEMLAALAPAASHLVFTAPASRRAAAPAELAARAAVAAPGVPVDVRDRPADALAHARALGSPIVVAGSMYLAGEILAELA